MGGKSFDLATGIAVDAANNAYVTGYTTSSDFPLLNAAQTIIDRNPDTVTNPNAIAGDAFVARLAADGRAFVYSTFLGGRSFDQGHAIATDAMGNAYVVGSTSSTDFPLTPNPLRATFAQREAFITKLAISADLAVAVSDEPDPVQTGGNLAYTVAVENNGPDPAASATATITLPQGASFVSATASQGTCTGNGPVNCALGNLVANAKATITMVVTPTAAGNITLQATATSATADINTANNSVSHTTKVSTLPSIFGKVTIGSGTGLSGVMMNLSGAQRPAITTAEDGRYQFAELAAGGNYTVTPLRQGYVFNPANRSFNNLTTELVHEVVDLVLSRFPHWKVGAVGLDGVFVNRAERPRHKDHNTNVKNLLRNPTIDLLLVGYDGDTLAEDGMVHVGHDMVVLESPSPAEELLARDLRPGGTLIKLDGRDVLVRRQGLVEEFALDPADGFGRVFLREIALLLESMG